MRGTTPGSNPAPFLKVISIHVPREWHDAACTYLIDLEKKFLSTCPVRGTTSGAAFSNKEGGISIHVPREGHDPFGFWRTRLPYHFYPRAP